MVDQRPLHAVLSALGSSGDVHPFIGVGRELARRGHAVTLGGVGCDRSPQALDRPAGKADIAGAALCYP